MAIVIDRTVLLSFSTLFWTFLKFLTLKLVLTGFFYTVFSTVECLNSAISYLIKERSINDNVCI